VPVTDARIALLERLIDHAPTFPPASLAPEEAIAEDRRAQASPHAFMLGRLVWPASRLGELRDEARELSVVADAPVPDDPRVDAIEVPPGGDVPRPGSRVVYREVAPGEAPARFRGAYAKVRCGGAVTPSVEELAAFLRRCRELGLPFKATAGLHHAVRTGTEHGFLNLLAAVVFEDEQAALAEEDPGAFALDERSFGWRDRKAAPDALAAARREGLHAIGSCSFFEPVEELAAFGMLP
jgi:hypothetical protein